jgi:hypothetical protein
MKFNAKQTLFFNIEVDSRITEASKLLSILAHNQIDFLAFKAISTDMKRTVFTLFSENASRMAEVAKENGFKANGPHSVVLVTGIEEIGALASIYEKIALSNIDVNESSGIAHINGAYGVILYLKPADCNKAIMALNK